MATPANSMKEEAMIRKPILMPPTLVSQVEKIAQTASKVESRNVSFAEIVRRAVTSYDPALSGSDDEMIEALLDGVIKSTAETAKTVRKLNKKLDKSYKELSREFE